MKCCNATDNYLRKLRVSSRVGPLNKAVVAQTLRGAGRALGRSMSGPAEMNGCMVRMNAFSGCMNKGGK